ncbi:hypothetical protein C8J56DRAFT_787620, partial [Mycena floridula]
FQLGLGFFAWGTGASRQMIEVMSRCHLTPSFTTICKVIKNVGDESINSAHDLVNSRPHLFAYDNYNASHSKHVEQRPGGPSKVESGTFPVIYKLYNACFEDMLIQPMIDNLKQAADLTVGEISPSDEQLRSYHFQAQVHIVRAFTTHHDGFIHLKDDPILQHRPRRQLPKSHRTKFYPLRVSQIEEASIKGNLHVHDDSYIVQLKQKATPGSQTFQLGMGLFHEIMNLIWGINKRYVGSVREVGTLKYYFSLLEKVRLGNNKPDYHALLAALQQILDGILLHAWLLECGHVSLEKFAASKPTPTQLLDIARRIIESHASPIAQDYITYDDCDSDTDESIETESTLASGKGDTAHTNITLLTRELLYVTELVQAVRDGDFGRIEDMYPDIARIFRGAGSFNYSTEILPISTTSSVFGLLNLRK